MMKKYGCKLLLVALLLLAPASALAVGPEFVGDCNQISWDASISPGVTGYVLHWGPTPGNYINTVDVLNVLTVPGCTSLGVVPGQWYMAVSAYDAGTGVSGVSNEIPFVLKLAPPSTLRFGP